ncbi:MAG: hypothetical protein NZ483_03760 [Verrucomicrobiae bacterium]|nr:hypothetical protein [Verrucomicrobiae bacterium]
MLVLLSLAVYVAIPLAPVRLCLLAGWTLWVLGSPRNDALLSFVAAAVYVAAFIPNPMVLLTLSPWAAELAFVIFGLMWWWIGCRARGPVAMPLPSWRFFVWWCGMALAAYWASWQAEVPYRGDESFHLISVQLRWLMLREVAVALLPVVAFAVVAWWRKGAWIVATVVLLFLLATWVSPGWYSPELINHEYAQFRLYRYPAAESWVAALLGGLGWENWSRVIFSNEMARLLSVWSVLSLGFVFGGDQRWRAEPARWTALATWGMVTSPNLLFHGAMAYLELPAILLATVVLMDAEAWLARPWPQVCRWPAWWAMVLLPFTKETALPVVLALVAGRMIAQWHRHESQQQAGGMRYRAQRLRATIRGEWPVWLTILGPATVYVALRTAHEFRGYPALWQNYLEPSLWWQALSALGRQYGLLVPLALCGAVVCRKRRRVRLAVGCFVAMLVFMVGDYATWIGSGRFNLMLLPPLLILGWEGLTRSRESHPTLARGAAVLLLATNFWLSPVGWEGRRGAWDVVQERWYPYRQCFEDIRARQPEARLALANMDWPYAYSIPMLQIGWSANVIQLPPQSVEAALQFASTTNTTVVIYRLEDDQQPPPMGFEAHGFRLTAYYPARLGGLVVFERVPEN